MTFEEWVEAAGFKYLHPEMKATLHEAYQAGAKDTQECAARCADYNMSIDADEIAQAIHALEVR